ncbi:poly(A) polymerase [gamma proteobacterium HTCC5015]|nr:poly(A) polymerase [gamma proteobacterium HTCC5015]
MRVCGISTPNRISSADHAIRCRDVPRSVLNIVARLNEAGHEAYLVGGCVRDLLIGLRPKDFDVATSATPDEVKALFRNCRLVGRRFRLAHILLGRDFIEVATFRAGQESAGKKQAVAHSDSGRILSDNVYGSLEQDAFRRDFSVNALYFDVRDESIVDYVGAMADIEARQLRLIGDPDTRYREDPVRMLRAVRFAAKLGFSIEPHTEAPIRELSDHLEDIPPARLFDEVIKLLQSGHGVASLDGLWQHDLLRYLLPMTYGSLLTERGDHWRRMLEQALNNTDARLAQGKSTNPAFLYAVLLWPPLREWLIETGGAMPEDGAPPVMQIQEAANEIFDRQIHYTAIPKRFSQMIRDMWSLQHKLENYGGGRAFGLLANKRFRAAYDFLLLREEMGENTKERANFWTQIQELDDEQDQMDLASTQAHRGPRRRRRRR